MTRKKPKPAALLVAAQTATIDVDGRPYPLLAGVTHVPRDHPAAKARPDLFQPATAPSRSSPEPGSEAG